MGDKHVGRLNGLGGRGVQGEGLGWEGCDLCGRRYVSERVWVRLSSYAGFRSVK